MPTPNHKSYPPAKKKDFILVFYRREWRHWEFTNLKQEVHYNQRNTTEYLVNYINPLPTNNR